VQKIEYNKELERKEWELEKLRKAAVDHRIAPSGNKARLSSIMAPKSDAQLAFEAAQLKKSQQKAAEIADAQRIENSRYTKKDNVKIDVFQQQKELEVKTRREQRGIAGEITLDKKAKELEYNQWDDMTRQGLTEGRRKKLMQGASVPKNSNLVVDNTTHSFRGHLLESEFDESGLLPGETLDEEGRVIPPWGSRGERYAGPKGEDEVRYPFDYGYGPSGFIEASRGKVPPPQLHLKDRSAAPRRDPDLYNEIDDYVPFGTSPAAYSHVQTAAYVSRHLTYPGLQAYPLNGPYSYPPIYGPY